MAEGVETQDQAERLRRTGCEELQGYLYSAPIPAASLPYATPQPAAEAPPARQVA